MTYKPNHAKLGENTKAEKIEIGSGNVFADLGFRNAEVRLMKAKVASSIAQLIEKKGLSQTQIAERIGVDQSNISLLLRGQLSRFSFERLVSILMSFDERPSLGRGHALLASGDV